MDDAERIQELREAGAALQGLVDDAAEIMVRFLIPNGISADQAMSEMIALLDGRRQREVEDRWQAVAGLEYASARAKQDAGRPDEKMTGVSGRVIPMPSQRAGKRRQ